MRSTPCSRSRMARMPASLPLLRSAQSIVISTTLDRLRVRFSSWSMRCMVSSSCTRSASCWSVMSNRRAFSMATAACPANVSSRSASSSMKMLPSVLLIVWSTPITRPPIISGTDRIARDWKVASSSAASSLARSKCSCSGPAS